MRKDVLKSVIQVFEKKQAFDEYHTVEPKDFKSLKYSTNVIVKMLGQLIENKIVICNSERQMYFNQESWNLYCSNTKKRMIFTCIGCCLFSLLVFLLITRGV